MNQIKQVQLMLVDDHPVVIEGLKASLKQMDWLEIVGTARSGQEALEKSLLYSPQIILLDVALSDISGIKVAEEIQRRANPPAMIAYTMYNDTEYLKLLVRAGVKGYLLKESSLDKLIEALVTVANGGTYFSPRATGTLLTGLLNGPQKQRGVIGASAESDLLTTREREILTLIAQGIKNRQIADQLSLNPRTVETHRRNMMMKLGIHSAAGLTRFAIEQGIIG